MARGISGQKLVIGMSSTVAVGLLLFLAVEGLRQKARGRSSVPVEQGETIERPRPDLGPPKPAMGAPPGSQAPKIFATASLSEAEKSAPMGSEDPLANMKAMWSAERVDPDWAPSTEKWATEKWRSIEAPGVALTAVECRSTVCQLRFSQTNNQVALNAVERFSKTFDKFPSSRTFVPNGSGEMVVYGFRNRLKASPQ